jgi:hypothetical protein
VIPLTNNRLKQTDKHLQNLPERPSGAHNKAGIIAA